MSTNELPPKKPHNQYRDGFWGSTLEPRIFKCKLAGGLALHPGTFALYRVLPAFCERLGTWSLWRSQRGGVMGTGASRLGGISKSLIRSECSCLFQDGDLTIYFFWKGASQSNELCTRISDWKMKGLSGLKNDERCGSPEFFLKIFSKRVLKKRSLKD